MRKYNEIGPYTNNYELDALCDLIQGASEVLEVGSFKGASAVFMADNSNAHITCVDKMESFLGGDDCDYKEIERELRKNIEGKNITFFKGELSEFKTDKKFDVVWIDGDHHYYKVRADILNAKKFVKRGGIICGHDYPLVGVGAAVDELVTKKELRHTIWIANEEDVIYSKEEYQRVAIGIPTSEFSRRSDFWMLLDYLSRPDNTVKFVEAGASSAKNRNEIISKAMWSSCTHILFLDDDMYPKMDIIPRLLSHNKDIVSGLYLMRSPPHYPVAFDKRMPDGSCKFLFLKEGMEGLIPVVNLGFGAVMIKTSVFFSLERPFVRLGELDKANWCDDIGFFNRVVDAGFQPYLDLECPVGHLITGTLYPTRNKGTWYNGIRTGTNGDFQFPVTIPNEEDVKKEEEKCLLQLKSE